ncbi:hypothetical protein BH24ACT5_BH24ACT5_10060 [soil metagenome]
MLTRTPGDQADLRVMAPDRDTSRVPRARAGRLVAVALVAGIGLAGCNRGGDPGTTDGFCAAVQDNLDDLRTTDFTTLDEARDLVDLYRTVGAKAPLAIGADWDTPTNSREIALTSDDEEEILATAYAAEPSAAAVHDWVQDNCGFDFGEVVSVLPPAASIDTNATTATTA